MPATIRRSGASANVGFHVVSLCRRKLLRCGKRLAGGRLSRGAGNGAKRGKDTVARFIFVYSTVDGHTRTICERLRDIAARAGHAAELAELTPQSEIDLQPYDGVVIGASIRYGKHRPEVAQFIDRNVELLRRRPAAFFSVNAVARKPDKRTPDTNPYVRKFLRTISWQPPLIGIFGGKIDYPRYGFIDKTMIRFIMWMTRGPTDPNAVVEFTDWDAVEAFGRAICDLPAAS